MLPLWATLPSYTFINHLSSSGRRMGDFLNASFLTLQHFRRELTQRARLSGSLEDMGRLVSKEFFSAFGDDIVLARFYATVPYESLPLRNKSFVDSSVESKGLESQLLPRTKILTLLGSAGIEDAWNDPYSSKNHLGIPLLSGTFVEEIPMIARLLQEVGVPMSWLEVTTGGVQTRTIGSFSGLFYVADARTARDDRDRMIIPAQSFVEKYRVQTVFGIGSNYLDSDIFITLVVFCNKRIDRKLIERLIVLPSELTAATATMVRGESLFRRTPDQFALLRAEA